MPDWAPATVDQSNPEPEMIGDVVMIRGLKKRTLSL
jgi:hypothetical protein